MSVASMSATKNFGFGGTGLDRSLDQRFVENELTGCVHSRSGNDALWSAVGHRDRSNPILWCSNEGRAALDAALDDIRGTKTD